MLHRSHALQILAQCFAASPMSLQTTDIVLLTADAVLLYRQCCAAVPPMLCCAANPAA